MEVILLYLVTIVSYKLLKGVCMRSTIEILIDVKDNIDVDKEELRMALLVLDSLSFLNRNHFKRLLKGGIGAELTATEFPDAYGELGISKHEYQALRMDPIQYLGEDYIPGTESWSRIHKIANNILNTVLAENYHER